MSPWEELFEGITVLCEGTRWGGVHIGAWQCSTVLKSVLQWFAVVSTKVFLVSEASSLNFILNDLTLNRQKQSTHFTVVNVEIKNPWRKKTFVMQNFVKKAQMKLERGWTLVFTWIKLENGPSSEFFKKLAFFSYENLNITWINLKKLKPLTSFLSFYLSESMNRFQHLFWAHTFFFYFQL